MPEALAIAREVFVSLLDLDDLTQLLPKWIRSLKQDEEQPQSPALAVVKAMDSLERSLDRAGRVRAVTNLCTVQPYGAAVAERALRGMRVYGYRPSAKWRRFPVALRFPRVGWEIASPVLTAARHQGVQVPEDFTRQIAQHLPDRIREPLSPRDINLVNAYARGLREQGQEQPGIRLAVACAVTSSEPVPMTQLIEIVHPNLQIREAAELFDQRGYPTEAVNVLMDSIQELPVGAAEWRQLLERIEQSLDEYRTNAKRPADREASPQHLNRRPCRTWLCRTSQGRLMTRQPALHPNLPRRRRSQNRASRSSFC